MPKCQDCVRKVWDLHFIAASWLIHRSVRKYFRKLRYCHCWRNLLDQVRSIGWLNLSWYRWWLPAGIRELGSKKKFSANCIRDFPHSDDRTMLDRGTKFGRANHLFQESTCSAEKLILETGANSVWLNAATSIRASTTTNLCRCQAIPSAKCARQPARLGKLQNFGNGRDSQL